MKSWILYEDNHLIIVNKPPKIPVQGDQTGDTTLIDIIKKYIKKEYNKPGNVYLGLPHRIDRPVSGIVVLTKTSKALSRMSTIFREKKITKIYWAIVRNKLKTTSGELIHFLKKNRKINKSFSSKIEKIGFLKSQLHYQLIKGLNNYYLYQIQLISGRHHQIRAQLSDVGSPIKGDIKYGDKKINKNGSIHLHARSIVFMHPIKKTKVQVIASPPDDIIWNACINQAS